jgi:hypothetical protein
MSEALVKAARAAVDALNELYEGSVYGRCPTPARTAIDLAVRVLTPPLEAAEDVRHGRQEAAHQEQVHRAERAAQIASGPFTVRVTEGNELADWTVEQGDLATYEAARDAARLASLDRDGACDVYDRRFEQPIETWVWGEREPQIVRESLTFASERVARLAARGVAREVDWPPGRPLGEHLAEAARAEPPSPPVADWGRPLAAYLVPGDPLRASPWCLVVLWRDPGAIALPKGCDRVDLLWAEEAIKDPGRRIGPGAIGPLQAAHGAP